MPFGGTFNSYTSGTENLYKYNGKEEQEETGWYDYGARMQDPWLGRFFAEDRFAEKYYDLSPYQYGRNNPISFVDINGDSTYLVIYGAGYLNSERQGEPHDVGDGFKKSAEALAEQIRNGDTFDSERDAVLVIEAKTSDQFVDATNTEYESGKIASLTVFSHGYGGGIALGGQSTADGISQSEADAQVSDYDSREINGNNVSRVDASNFESSAYVTLNGCNIGGFGSNSFTQTFADHLGTPVRAFNNYSEFPTKGGDGKTLNYNGRMIRSVDRHSQNSVCTIFKPKKP